MERSESLSSSWPGLSRPSTSCRRAKETVDARHKAGHDDMGLRRAPTRLVLAIVLVAAAALLPTLATPAASAPEMTDIALVLAVDVSESVTPERYALQMEGIARAFHDREVQGSILSGAHHSMYVTL